MFFQDADDLDISGIAARNEDDFAEDEEAQEDGKMPGVSVDDEAYVELVQQEYTDSDQQENNLHQELKEVQSRWEESKSREGADPTQGSSVPLHEDHT